MIENYKHIIWDWNGTILNDVELCVELINELLTKYNLKTLSLNEYREIFTIPVRDYYVTAGFDFSKDSFEVIGKMWMDEYERRKYECGLHTGISEIFEKINSMNIGQSVLSAYSQHTLEEMIDYYGLRKYFEHIVGLDNIYAASKLRQGKDLMKRLGGPGEKVLLIGDTLHDYEVASEIGADCLLISDGHQCEEKFRSISPQNGTLWILPSAGKLLG